MARTFRRPRPSQPISELNVTNLIDLGFTLLIIFMIATPLIQQEQTIPVNLPVESRSAQTPPDPKQEFVAVAIDQTGNFYFANRAITLADLRRELDAIAAGPARERTVIRIRADGKVPYERVVAIMDELKHRGLKQITFDTQAAP